MNRLLKKSPLLIVALVVLLSGEVLASEPLPIGIIDLQRTVEVWTPTDDYKRARSEASKLREKVNALGLSHFPLCVFQAPILESQTTFLCSKCRALPEETFMHLHLLTKQEALELTHARNLRRASIGQVAKKIASTRKLEIVVERSGVIYASKDCIDLTEGVIQELSLTEKQISNPGHSKAR